MSKKPVVEFFEDKFIEYKGKINEQMRVSNVIENAKRQIVDASRRRMNLQKYQLHALYYEAIRYLYFNLKTGEIEFYKALKKILFKVEKQIDKKIMMCALTEFCRSHPAEVTPNMLHEYIESWHSKENDLFSLIGVVNYKPFWQYMLKHKVNKFDLENILHQSEDKNAMLKEIISWIASDKDYVEVFFEDYFDFFINQILQYIYYTAENVEQITLEEVFGVICNALPKYEVKLLNYTYLHYLDKEEEEWLTVRDFMYILNRMADYEYATRKDVFCKTGLFASLEGDYRSFYVVADAHDIIYKNSLNMEVAEIAWILQNRFGVEESVINDAIAESAIEKFAGGNLNDLVHNEKLAPLFQFPVAYNLFMLYFDDIVKNTARCAFVELEEKYGIECKVIKA
ncbi:MAG: hypothetical protein J6B87_00835 [Clostridia bacterium]|nr:hypothetical protein [Clostridia bacterium]